VWQVHRVAFRTDRRNDRSRSAIERLGAQFDGILRAERPGTDGTIRDSAFYSVIAPEWPEVKANLTRRLNP
jgi:RimJ/RimL family protein N-acetyltransferase